jgi:hypothetical protein
MDDTPIIANTDPETETSDPAADPNESDCAWCNQENGIDQGEESHGICATHAEQLYAVYQMRRAA